MHQLAGRITSVRKRRTHWGGVTRLGVALALAAVACDGTVATPNLGEEQLGLATCDNAFHWVAVTGAVCLDGSATGFVYRCFSGVGASGPLVVNFDGGGACWAPSPGNDGTYCQCSPNSNGECQAHDGFPPGVPIERNHFNNTSSYAVNVASGIFAQANYSGSTSPFNSSWNQVLIPYCTGDVYAGNRLQTYTYGVSGHVTAHHKGYSNVGLDLAQISSLFTPSKIAFWGSSGGGLGVDCNLNQIHTKWPSVATFSLDNSGAPLTNPQDTDIHYASGPSGWGVWALSGTTVTSQTCPFNSFDHSLGDWSPDATVAWNENNMTTIRKALVDDYLDGTMNLFAGLMNCAGGSDPNACTIEPTLTLTNLASYIDAHAGSTTYKEYFHVGTCHAEREANGNATGCNYDDQVASHVKFNDFVRGWMLVSGYTWNSVEAHVVKGNVTIQSGSSPVTYTKDVLILPAGTNETDSGNVTIN
jgi:hypothetical protein